jgi:hypothetical protein
VTPVNFDHSRYGTSLYLVCIIAWLPFLSMSCGRKQANLSQTQPSLAIPNEAATPTPEPATPTPATPTVKVPVMMIAYQTQTTANQFSAPPGMRGGPTVGEEIRYLDLVNKRMRLEQYVLSGSGKKLYQTMIINRTGSYRLDPAKNEAVYILMAKAVPVWSFDDNINLAWAREHGLTVQPGEWLGRKCDVIGLGGDGKVWLWNDIPLKKEKKNIGSETTIQASRIEENAEIDASLLELPEGMAVRSASGK